MQAHVNCQNDGTVRAVASGKLHCGDEFKKGI